ncbi:MAG: glyoxalase [Rhizobium sp. 63-7]|nr:MAG: glyoxalase [Rhizobium sp. 63-7]
MAVLRIVANLKADDPSLARSFYRDLLGLDVAMDHGWITTFAGEALSAVQVSIASEGGSGTPVPALSIEVDDIDDVFARAVAAGFDIVYGPADEPWGVRRFFLRDPFGNLVNILSHAHQA